MELTKIYLSLILTRGKPPIHTCPTQKKFGRGSRVFTPHQTFISASRASRELFQSILFADFSVFNITEFLREEVVVLLTAQFITLFNQTALEVRSNRFDLSAKACKHSARFFHSGLEQERIPP